MREITVTFPGVRVLDVVSMRLFPGEVHALLGENGAGKTTLIKVLTGVHRPVEGEILLRGEPVSVRSPSHAQTLGISTVHQEINLATNLSVAENVMLGRERRRFGAIDRKDMRRRTAEVLAQLHVDVDPGSPLASDPLAVQQLVSIARAVQVDAQVLVLDEPTSSLDTHEVDELFEVVDRIRASGVAVLFVSHFLDQVYRISDRITVLRNGRLVAEHLTAELPRLQLVSEMLGHDRESSTSSERDASRAPTPTRGRRSSPRAVSGAVRASGRWISNCATARSSAWPGCSAPAGPRRPVCSSVPTEPITAQIIVDGEEVRLRNPRVAFDLGIAFASENRRTEGLISDLSVRANIVLAMQSARGWARAIPRRQQAEIADRYIKALDIRPTDPEAIVRNLSGGNQQKVLLARWLLTAPKLLILDEPTRGIDVGAKAEIQRLVAVARRRRHVGVVHLGRARGGAPAVASHRRDARAAQGRRDREPRHHRDDLMRIIAEGADPVADEAAS